MNPPPGVEAAPAEEATASSAARPAALAGGPLAGLGAALLEQRLLIGLVAAIVAIGYAMQAALGLPDVMRNLRFAPSYWFFANVLPLPLPFALLLVRLRTRAPDGTLLVGRAGWALTWRRFRASYFNTERATAAILAGLCIAVSINAFGAWKLSIPRVHPFDWDARIAAFDKALHFGRYPYQWLQPILGHPGITVALDITYYTWLPLVAAMCAWQAWTPRRELRLRFFLTFILSWVLLGDVLATIFSSAGPCYYDRVVAGPNPFAPLFAYHAEVLKLHLLGTPLVQQALWEHYTHHTTGPYTGISAFPSIHVSMPVLYSLLTWRISRKLAIPFIAYAVVIWLGSIHLGWHYAVDGYVSLMGVSAIWWFTGVVLRRFAPDIGAGDSAAGSA